MPQPASQSEINVGDIRVVYLPDGHGKTDPTTFFAGSTPQDWETHRKWLDQDGYYVTTIGGFLIQSNGRNVLFDMGLGDRDVDLSYKNGFRGVSVWTGGHLLKSLKVAGLEPSDIDTVVISHLHLEHCGWASRVVSDARVVTFPNARHLMMKAEWQYWCETDPWEVDHSSSGPGLELVQKPLEGRAEWLRDGEVVAPGVNVLATPGHTPGHLSLVVSSGADRAIIFGDVVHCPAQLEEAEWSCFYDLDRNLAKRTRERLWAELEDPSTVAAASHFPDLIFGRLVQAEGKRQWSAFS